MRLGVTAALRKGGVIDFLSVALALVGISVPSFVVAAVLLRVFGDWLHWLPTGGWGTVRQMILPGVAPVAAPDGVYRAADADFDAG